MQIRISVSSHIPYILACHLQIDADPDPAYHFDPYPDPAYHLGGDADPDPDLTFQFDADPNSALHLSEERICNL
jgi:hypothetical protein